MRFTTAFTVLQWGGFTFKERLFIAMTWVPKVCTASRAEPLGNSLQGLETCRLLHDSFHRAAVGQLDLLKLPVRDHGWARVAYRAQSCECSRLKIGSTCGAVLSM